ncbi:MAG: hypothetical protein OXD29_00230 [Roseovarius sp.]|nr:hypothetical protein [Roseovarius sp.]MCY4206367.1 hypothetical protein [Roseovarius sp.]MCY4292715.1 hypothetical protein [Roseovarius sp.]MCY4315939.1 hypothetical protein [Roseovarius sp.]
MMTYLSLWWVWGCAAVVLVILEVAIPGNLFLGVALGALAMAGATAVFDFESAAFTMAVFSALSLAGWLFLRYFFRSPDDQTRVIHKDINK